MASRILLKGGTVYKGFGNKVIKNGFVEIVDGKVGAVGAVADLTSGFDGEVIDTTGKTVTPGVIDTHMHVFHEPQMLRLSEGAAAIWGANYAQSALRAGVTTMRDLGAQSGAVFGLKKALNEGYTVGPRYLVSGRAICMTGGHGWANLSAEADGEDGVRLLARQQIKLGADVIKVMASGGAGTPGELPTQAQFSMQEIRAAVDVAHDAGKPVAAHALATEGIIRAVEAGVDTIEHGVFLDDWAIELMLKKNVALCPTISVYPRIINRGPAGGEAPFVMEKSVSLLAPHFESLRKAVAAGVRIVFGTDATTLYNPVGDFSDEMDLMVKAGMSPVEVIRSATSTASDICGVSNIVGTLETGKLADVLVIDGDATKDIAALSATAMVFKEGTLVYRKGEGYRNAMLTAKPILKADHAL
ncbi:amidohydrolase family protein [Neorhizobium sp. Rsf11]|uniref:Amidohydrolase family protein n=2 Tax=Neorhizobium TaxID=1525371 RepID=A0ABV0MAW8_9HYPH|nr:amidohydrolase family protein [Neorhizobium petrolearium]MCC2613810.1 amidohydrolase family protein [Neorhizobium petrolearium]WGI72119.1 amidohydrolase family protein [Neorhizobium petrolearium]